MGNLNIMLYETPPREVDILDWIYRQLTAAVVDGAVGRYDNPVLVHVLTGGELVEIEN